MIKRTTLLIAAVLLASCSKKNEMNNNIHQINELSQDIKIPRQIMAEIVGSSGAQPNNIGLTYVFMPIQVRLTQSDSQALASDKLIFSFPKGGGELDLKSIVKGQGSFYFSFPEEQFDDLSDPEHIYYISHSPKKEIDNESFGLGCDKWVDLKKYFSKLKKENFLKVNTTDQRHLFVLSGTYIFVFKKANQILLSQLSVGDSRYKELMCLSESGEKI